MTCHPDSLVFARAWISDMNTPIGFVGFAKAGSCRSTTVWVTTTATCLFSPRDLNSFRRALCNMYPMAPCVFTPPIIQRFRGQLTFRYLALPIEKADLGTVAVSDHKIKPFVHQVGYEPTQTLGHLVLIRLSEVAVMCNWSCPR